MLVFSSAEITNSSSSKGLPSQWRAYRSSMRPALSAKLGIAWEDPATVVPRPNGVLMQPAPKRAATDGSHPARLTGLSGQIRGTPARQRQVVRGWKSASPSLDLHHQIRGKKSGDDPDESVLLSQRGVRQKTAYAKNRRLHGGCQTGSNPVVGQSFGGQKNHLGALDLKIR